jgi:hypothetical protein
MRCYFLNDGRIVGVEMLPRGLSDKNAIARAHMLSLKRKGPFDGLEVWHRSRMVFRYQAPSTAEDGSPIRPGPERPLTDDGTHRDALGPDWPWPVARH